MTSYEWAKKIWSKLEELQVVDTDGLDPRMENAITQITLIIHDAREDAIDTYEMER